MNNKNHVFKRLAEIIFFRGITEENLLKNFKYKKGKSFKDVVKAFERGIREGRGRFESEIEMAALRLSKVLEPIES